MLAARLARLAQVLIFVCVFFKQEDWSACQELDSIIGLELTAYVGLKSKMDDQGQRKKFFLLSSVLHRSHRKKKDRTFKC